MTGAFATKGNAVCFKVRTALSGYSARVMKCSAAPPGPTGGYPRPRHPRT
jgi:hypothetical protein